MSRVPYTINVDEYICSVLEQMRKMDEHRDYSGLAAAIERIQFHASKMEDALYSHKDLTQDVRAWVKDENITSEEFKQKCKEAVERYDLRR